MSFDESLLPKEANDYLERTIRPPFAVLERMEKEIRAEGQPAVGRQTGALLRGLALARGTARVLEVGTNVGYSALWLCAGLAPRGRFEGIEIDPGIAARAKANLREAASEGRAIDAHVHVGAALDVLPTLPERSYDLVFLDAVKAEYPQYLDHALRLAKPGAVVAADNMFWRGAVWEPASRGHVDADTSGIREYTRRIFSDARLVSTLVPVEDGLGLSIVVG